MIRAITIILISIPFLVIGFAYTLPTTTEVSRSIIINAKPSTVYNLLVDLKQWQDWSPWAEKDPNITLRFEGAEQGVGAIMHWQSENPQVGSGMQKIVGARLNKGIKIDLAFSGQNPAQAFFELVKTGENETRLLWAFRTEHDDNPINRYMGLMFDFWLGPDYEKGLVNIKRLSESTVENDESSGSESEELLEAQEPQEMKSQEELEQ